jgi:hypothetical protein
MGLDPTGAIGGTLFGIATNLATDILKHYAQKLDNTLVGRGLKAIGLIEQTRDDHLREVLEEALRLYFETHPVYDISGVIDFFRDPATAQQIGNYIFDHQPTDQQAIEAALARHIKNDALSMILLQRRGGQPEHIVRDFLACYRQILNTHTDVAERAILLTVLDATDSVIAEICASEERMKAFVSEAVRQHIQALRDQTTSLAAGQIIGKYRIQSHLSTGTFGSLYRAEVQETGTLVVLKAISVPQGLRLHYDVFSLGARLINLHHPSILPTLDVCLDDTPPHIVTAYVTGGSLYERIHHNAPQPLPLSEAFTIISQIGLALAYLHKQQIIHRGIQPASTLFDSTGHALLTGFDLAIMAHAAKHHLQSNSVGTTNYMAPEQLHGIATEKSDQYALACIAYELCTGRLPYKEVPFSTTQGRPKPPLAPRLFNHKLSVQAERAILRALSISPDQRYNDVSAFVTALEAS